MNTYRKTAIIVGVLYIIGTVAGVLSVVFTGPILDASDVSCQSGCQPQSADHRRPACADDGPGTCHGSSPALPDLQEDQ